MLAKTNATRFSTCSAATFGPQGPGRLKHAARTVRCKPGCNQSTAGTHQGRITQRRSKSRRHAVSAWTRIHPCRQQALQNDHAGKPCRAVYAASQLVWRDIKWSYKHTYHVSSILCSCLAKSARGRVALRGEYLKFPYGVGGVWHLL